LALRDSGSPGFYGGDSHISGLAFAVWRNSSCWPDLYVFQYAGLWLVVIHGDFADYHRLFVYHQAGRRRSDADYAVDGVFRSGRRSQNLHCADDAASG